MEVTALVRLGNFVIVNFRKPIVCGDGARVRKDQTTDRVGHGGVFLYAPVGNFYVAVNQFLVVKDGGLHVTKLFALSSVKNVRFCHIGIACLDQNAFHAVLNVFHGDFAVNDLRFEIGCYLKREQVNDRGMILFVLCFKRLGDGG